MPLVFYGFLAIKPMLVLFYQFIGSKKE